MLWGSECQKLNEGDLHSQESSKNVEDIVCGHNLAEFLSFLRFMSDEIKQYKNGDNVDDERVATPWGNHVEVW